MIIDLTEEEIKQCLDFSFRSAINQQKIEFGQHDTRPRNNREIGRDNLIGKMAEVAFAKMIKDKYRFNIDLDFNYYPRGVWDKQDAEINGWRIDVKGTRQGGKWLLVEWSKLSFRCREGNLSHLYVMASVKWDRENDCPLGQVELVGCAGLNWFNENHKNFEGTLILRKGENIPGTRTPVQADNYAIKFEDLETDWDMVIDTIWKNSPPDISTFLDPFNENRQGL